MYHRRFDYMRYAKSLGAGLSLGQSGVPHRSLETLSGVERALKPDPMAAPRLKALIAERYGVQPECVVLTVGASQANELVALAYARPGDEVLVERPAYEALVGLFEWLGVTVRRIDRRPEEGWALDLDCLDRSLTPRTRLVVLTHPHNPTGAPCSAADLTRLRELARERQVPVLVDEIYRDDLARPPPLAADGKCPVITTSSLTKVYGIGWLRVGWAIAPPDVARQLVDLLDWMHVVAPSPSLSLALLAWPRLDLWLDESRAAIAASREVLDLWRARTGLLPGAIADGMPFYLAELPVPDDRAFAERAKANGLVIVPGAFFETPGRSRIGFGRLTAPRLAEALAIVERVTREE